MRALPEAFTAEMEAVFRQYDFFGEWPAFLASFEEKPDGGLRANSQKIKADELRRLLSRALDLPPERFKPVSWSDDGLYFPAGCQPGRLAYHAAGLYYIQEPSAMLPAAVLAAQPGEKILDLCAAPGGKTCRIAADLQGKGLLWANEISANRVRALLHNVELTGCPNCLITQETPDRLAGRMPAFFDRILVDAPCSGSGMFRRDPASIDSWLAYGSQHCTAMQRDILLSAWTMLKPGGILVYSTCTFSVAENEAMIAWLLEQQPDGRILPIAKRPGVSDGLPLMPEMSGTARIWPHRATGDGHFCAMIQKNPIPGIIERTEPSAARNPIIKEEAAAWQAFDCFCHQNLSAAGCAKIEGMMRKGGPRYDHDCLHLLPEGCLVPEKLKKVKTGLFLGQVKKLRDGSMIYEPSPAFLLSLEPGDLRFPVCGEPDSDLVRRYLRGETITLENSSASLLTTIVTAGHYAAVILAGQDENTKQPGQKPAGWPLGWARGMAAGQLKNLYPQAWRRMT